MNLSAVDLNLLTAFEALSEERNVSRAAVDVGITQPAMSNALARLRLLFDDPLLVRAGRTMVLTSRAQELEGPIRQALALIRTTLLERGSASISTLVRTFIVGASEYAEHLLLPRVLDQVEKIAPNIRLVVRRLPTLFQVPDTELREGLLNLAIGFFDDGPALGPGLFSDLLLRDRHVSVFRKRHSLAHRRLTLDQFQSLGHVAVFYRSDHWSLLDHALKQRGIERRIVVRVPHMVSALAVVAQTDLICTLPHRLALAFASSMGLRCVPLPIPLPPAKCSVAWHARHDHDQALRWLREQIKNAASSRRLPLGVTPKN